MNSELLWIQSVLDTCEGMLANVDQELQDWAYENDRYYLRKLTQGDDLFAPEPEVSQEPVDLTAIRYGDAVVEMPLVAGTYPSLHWEEPKTLPLVHYHHDGSKETVGTAEIKADGTMVGHIDEAHASVFLPAPPGSYSLGRNVDEVEVKPRQAVPALKDWMMGELNEAFQKFALEGEGPPMDPLGIIRPLNHAPQKAGSKPVPARNNRRKKNRKR